MCLSFGEARVSCCLALLTCRPRKGWKLREVHEADDPIPSTSSQLPESDEEPHTSPSGLEATAAPEQGKALPAVSTSPSSCLDEGVQSAAVRLYSPLHSKPRPPSQPAAGAFLAYEPSIQDRPLPLTLEHLLEPDSIGRSSTTGDTGAAPWLSYVDPVAIGLLSDTEARYLFLQ